MNTLAGALRHEFESGVRIRGNDYYARGLVEIIGGDGPYFNAVVTGRGGTYMVALQRQGPILTVACECPYFAGGKPCKHIWAAIAAADRHGSLGRPPAFGRMELALADVEPAEQAEEADEADFEEEEFPVPADDDSPPAPRKDIAGGFRAHAQGHRQRDWRTMLSRVTEGYRSRETSEPAPWPTDDRVEYVVDSQATQQVGKVVLAIQRRPRKKNGEWGVPRPQAICRKQVEAIPDPVDRQVASVLTGSIRGETGWHRDSDSDRYLTFHLAKGLWEAVAPLLSRTGRFYLRGRNSTQTPLTLDEGPAWQFWLTVARDEQTAEYVLRGQLRRDETVEPLAAAALLVEGGWVFWPERVARLDDSGAFGWIEMLRGAKELRVPAARADELVQQILRVPRLPRLDLPEELRFEMAQGRPTPCLRIRKPREPRWSDRLDADLSFRYEDQLVHESDDRPGTYLAEARRLLLRDQAAERAALQRLADLGFRRYGERLELTPKWLPRAVRALVAEDWLVEAEGALYRNAGAFRISVASGIDWFELHGEAQFGETSAAMPALLEALRKGENLVRLDDGSFGVLPEQWLRKFGFLAGMGEMRDDHVRFTSGQAGLLDALLAAQPEAACDATFSRVREELRRFESIEAADAPAGFAGTLRPYQRDGLGWLGFLQRFGFGGCLADDMGLGKTVQVLAMLESRRQAREETRGKNRPGPSLAVVPRSLIFNWKEEAARFTPKLRILDHTGILRAKDGAAHFKKYDLVLTTYGTLRQDIVHLKDVPFDYVILDESQTVKNAATAAAKAVLLLRGSHRLCLSGTPIENHLGELWSQFQFLNPGMLGTSGAFGAARGKDRQLDDSQRAMLARALRPFILRRTKQQVAADLPEKTEQTLSCQLDADQRKLYDELRDHYRKVLLAKVGRDGLNKCKIQVLEALLRLRQAACHPGLIDPARASGPSAKLEALLPQLAEVTEEGHKALVFSQFTSMLAIVRDRLDAAKIPYAYLDGQTRDRREPVDRFQNDPSCGLFLISLKAGGLGLNLTAAEYVFLLDPWWNPAVEAQAIDRAHRIGQTNPVFAYRLIAADTVEERVLELQQSKRALADAIINADNSLIRSLRREDLELLLT